MRNCYKKSTLKATAVSQTLATGDNVNWTVQNQTGTAISLDNGGTSISLNREGIYLVEFFGTTTPTAENESITLQLNKNGVAETNGTATRTPESVTDIENFAFSDIIDVNRVCCGGSKAIKLTFTNTSTSAIYNIAGVTIVKLA